MKNVWIFNGVNGRFPSAVFYSFDDAKKWIFDNKLSGVLTEYPVGISVYEWAINNGNFKIKSERDESPEFIQKFSSASQNHFHFERGACE